MSVVLAVCSTNFFKIMSDGRLVKFDNTIPFDARRFTIEREDYPKIIKVAEHWAVGIGGSGNVAFSLFDEIRKRSAYKTLSLEQIVFKIKNKLRSYEKQPVITNVLVGGLKSNRKYSLYILSSESEYEPVVLTPQKNEFEIKGAFPKMENHERILQQCIYDNAPYKDIQHLDSLMRSCIEAVADVEPSVNKRIFDELIAGGQI